MLKYGKSVSSQGTRSIGSKMTAPAAQHAQKVATGSNRNHKAPAVDSKVPRASARTMHRGSSAGLKNEKNVRLAINNTGYYKKSNQIARNKPKNTITQKMPSLSGTINNVKRTSDRTNDPRLTSSSTSSISRINKKINKG
jgi:hypothetical protein